MTPPVVSITDLEAEIARACGQAPTLADAPTPSVRVVFPKWFQGAILAVAGIHGYSVVPSSTESAPAIVTPSATSVPIVARELTDRESVLGLPGYHLVAGTDDEKRAACIARGGCPKHGQHASSTPCTAP